MSPTLTETPPSPLSSWPALLALQATLRAAGAAQLDPVGWHYAERLAERASQQTGAAQALLCDKLQQALSDLKARLDEATAAARHGPTTDVATRADAPFPAPSPLAALLRDMTPSVSPDKADAGSGTKGDTNGGTKGATKGGTETGVHRPLGWRAESPRVRQFRKQLGQIQVQKQVSQAIAQAPQNAGPINSHMLVLRSLGLIRNASPDYLNRFMAYVDTLLCLDAAGQTKLPPKKPRR